MAEGKSLRVQLEPLPRVWCRPSPAVRLTACRFVTGGSARLNGMPMGRSSQSCSEVVCWRWAGASSGMTGMGCSGGRPLRVSVTPYQHDGSLAEGRLCSGAPEPPQNPRLHSSAPLRAIPSPGHQPPENPRSGSGAGLARPVRGVMRHLLAGCAGRVPVSPARPTGRGVAGERERVA